MISNLEQTILNAVQQQSEIMIQQQQQQIAAQTPSITDTNNAYKTWSWKGRVHPVPEDFDFPSDNLSNIWNLWWDGRPSERIAPYRKLQPYDLDKKSMRTRFIKARKVMEFITQNTGKSANDIPSSTSAEKVTFLQDAYVRIFQEWYGDLSTLQLDRRTLATMSFMSFYDLIKGNGRKKKYGRSRLNSQQELNAAEECDI